MILGGVSLAEDYPHVFSVNFSGSEILSGGMCKMEGSIVVFLFNVLSAVFFAWRIYSSRKDAIVS